MTTNIVLYTDGACSGNPGPGGWGVVVLHPDGRRDLFGGEAQTTNNRMEMTAAIRALEAFSEATPLTIITDSEYVKKGMTEWLAGWKKKGWKTAAKQPVKNEDLWRQLDALNAHHKVTWEWVRGHAGNTYNEEADRLARQGIASILKG
jgi:ribonuclease HI